MKSVIYTSIPIGSVLSLPQEERLAYLDKIVYLPRAVQDVLFAKNTGAFVRGLTKSYGLLEDKLALVALLIVRIATRDDSSAKLTRALSAELGLPRDQMLRMVQEIEHDLFGEIKDQLGVRQPAKLGQPKEKPAAKRADTRDLSNVLDLTSEKKTTPPPPMPPPPKP